MFLPVPSKYVKVCACLFGILEACGCYVTCLWGPGVHGPHASTSQLPFKTPQIPSDGDHKALTLLGSVSGRPLILETPT